MRVPDETGQWRRQKLRGKNPQSDGDQCPYGTEQIERTKGQFEKRTQARCGTGRLYRRLWLVGVVHVHLVGLILIRRQRRSGRNHFDGGLEHAQPTFNALKGSRNRTRAGAARALVMYDELVAAQTENVQVAAVALQVGSDFLVKYQFDLAKALLVFVAQIRHCG